jgi:uncharacterized protein (TIRG00374 family)
MSGREPRARAWGLRSPRTWVGLAVTVVTVWLSLRGVSFSALAHDLRGANLLILVLYSLPAHLLTLWLRALRWRHLTDAVQPIGPGPLFRATAIGFMVNNLVPLRVGEVVRVWSLSRETGASGAALLGTVLLERLIDVIVVLGLAFVLLGSQGGALPLSGSVLAILVAPVGLVALLRFAPERVLGWVTLLRRFGLSEGLVEGLQRLLRSFADGLGSLRGGRHLFWIAFHSILIWGVVSPIPFFGTLEALHIDLGSLSREIAASYATLVAVGVAVALPSAPGFFGPFHFAARLALTRFGLDDSTALAVGTLAHAAFWVIVTGTGLVVLRFRRTSLDETLEAAQAEPE